jgi:hypothetical protein
VGVSVACWFPVVLLTTTGLDSVSAGDNRIAKETLENQADLRDNDHVIAGAHWGDGQ